MLIFNLAAAVAQRHSQHQWVRLTNILDCFCRASIMSEVFPGTDLKCEEITMAVYRMQNLQLLSNTGQKCCKYNAEYIWTHSIFYHVDLEVELFFCIPVDLLLLTWICHPHLYSIGCVFFLNDRKVFYVFNRGTLYTRLLFSFRTRCFSVIHAIGAFTWNAATRRFQECQKVRCLYCLASPVASRLSFQSPFSTDGRMGLSLSRQWGSGGLLGALHAYQMIPASLGRFAISGLQYWPYSEACNDGVRTLVGHLAGDSYKSHGLVQQADTKSISEDSELIQCFSYRFSRAE